MTPWNSFETTEPDPLTDIDFQVSESSEQIDRFCSLMRARSAKVRAAAEEFGAEPVIPVRRGSRVKDALKVGRDFVTRGAQRLVELFRGRWSVERLFGRAKEWLLLGCLRLRGLEQVAIHAALSFMAMLAVAHAAVRCREPGLMRRLKHFTA